MEITAKFLKCVCPSLTEQQAEALESRAYRMLHYDYQYDSPVIPGIKSFTRKGWSEWVAASLIAMEKEEKALEERIKLRDERIAADHAKEQERKARKAAREQEKARELNMTEAEYAEYQKLEAKKRRYASEIRCAERKAAEILQAVEYKRKWLAEH